VDALDANAVSLLRAKPDPSAVRVHLVAEAPPGLVDAAAVQRAADAALGVDAAGERWTVEPVFEAADVEQLGAFFEVSGRLNAATLPRSAFDAAYRLQAALRAESGPEAKVRPDLESTLFARPYAPGPAPEASPQPSPRSDPRRWSLEAIRCPEAWATTPAPDGAARGRGIVIGHPDTGYGDHPELDRAALDLDRDFDFVNGDADARDPMDPNELPEGHGTRTGAVIAGRTAGEIAGAAPEATLVPIRATKSVALVRGVGVAKAVDHARRNGCHIVSMSLGGVLLTGALEAAIQAAVRSGTIVMAAAGNWDWAPFPLPSRAKFVVEPARYRSCLAVAACNADSAPWFGSSRGSKVLISAPGESVWVPAMSAGANVTRSSGTSYGVAHLAGVAALWLGHWGVATLRDRYGASNVQSVFVQVLREHGFRRPEGWDTGRFGVGIVDAKALLDAPLPALPPTRELVETAAPRTSSRERLEAVLGAEEPGEADARLAQLFRAPPERLDEDIELLGDEVAYLLAENPDFLRHANVESGGPESASDGVAAVRALLASAGSPQLAESVAAGA